MALIPYADIEKLPEKAREAFDRLPRKLNIFRMWANAPDCFVSGMRFGGNILARQKLNAALRELVILLVARIEGGTYEWVQHVPIAEAAGCKKDQIKALEASRLDDPAFDAREKVLLRFAREVIVDVRASGVTLKEAQKHFSPQEIVEIILTCGFYMTMARMTETTGVDVDAPAGMEIVKNLDKMR
ncbi:MAG: carboxymuconolactone decarboxylase family protein [Proteobacteria bacterium]|nr:carboxymuconolactone decarboxylase family protein [Pseudomonadota bacterium]